MRVWKTAFLMTGALLAVTAATGQQPAESNASSQAVSPSSAVSPAPSNAVRSRSSQSDASLPSPAPEPQPTTMEQVVDRVLEREHALIKFLSNRTPIVETYLQNFKPDTQLGAVPTEDHYFLGRMDMGDNIDRKDYLKEEDRSMQSRLLGGFHKLFTLQYQPMGFAWMVYADRNEFDHAHYQFRYVRREFLGDIRCFVFDVKPKPLKGNEGRGRFVGRIWVEDQGYNIVRLNGTYSAARDNTYFFHMDSWRLNLTPGYWVPSFIYSEEGDFSAGGRSHIEFKAQTRIWGYDLKKEAKDNELTQISVDSVKDESPATQDLSPLQAEREWQEQAEDNVVDRLTNGGLLAPEGDVDHVLQQVVNNLIVTNNIDLSRPVRVRILLTSPLETLSVGNTIIISRGLVDVLPDEASLAALLAHELAHIVLGHNLGSKYAFNDRMLFSDDTTYANLGFKHVPEEEAAADKKAIDLLNNSPYAGKLDNVGLFLKELQSRAHELNALLTTHLGNPLGENGTITRLSALENKGPALDENKLDQIAALPLGARIKVNPWNDTAEMMKSAPVSINSARDKLPFEVTPFYPRLIRYNGATSAGIQSGSATTAANAH